MKICKRCLIGYEPPMGCTLTYDSILTKSPYQFCSNTCLVAWIVRTYENNPNLDEGYSHYGSVDTRIEGREGK